MIKSVSVKNKFLNENFYPNKTIKMELSQPWSTGLAITSIGGIGPVKATINQLELVTLDGALFNSARMSYRNITFTIRLMDVVENGKVTKTMEQVRHDLYSVFPPKEEVTLYFETDTYYYKKGDDHRLWITGRVESNEPDIFSKEESHSVSIICSYPFFTSMVGQSDSTESSNSKFEFISDGSDDALVTMDVGTDLTGCYLDITVPANYSFGGTTQMILKATGGPDYTVTTNRTYTDNEISASTAPADLFIDEFPSVTTELRYRKHEQVSSGGTIYRMVLDVIVGSKIYTSQSWYNNTSETLRIQLPEYVGTITELNSAANIANTVCHRVNEEATFLPHYLSVDDPVAEDLSLYYEKSGNTYVQTQDEFIIGDKTYYYDADIYGFEFSWISKVNVVNIFYDGEITTGCIFRLAIYGNVENPTIWNLDSNVIMTIDTSKIKAIVGGNDDDLLAGDEIELSTIYNDKYIKLRRNGEEYSILGCLPKDTEWMQLQDGNNRFMTTATSGEGEYVLNVNTSVIYTGI